MKYLLAIAILCAALLSFSGAALAQEGKTEPAPGVNVEAGYKALKNRKNYIFNYDRFKDRTAIGSKPHDLLTTGEHMATAFLTGLNSGQVAGGQEPVGFPSVFVIGEGFTYEGKMLCSEPTFAIYFSADSGSWEFLKDHHLYAIIDGERLDLGDGTHDGDIHYTGVSEQLAFVLTREQFAKFANGKSVEIKLGTIERKLKPERVGEFADLLSLATLPNTK